MSSGGGSAPTPNRTCTAVITTNVKLSLVYTGYGISGGHWQVSPVTTIAANSNALQVFVANGETPSGTATYITDDGTEFVLTFTMNGNNSANILGNKGTPQLYNYDKTMPSTGDAATVAFNLSRQQ